jgi:hypothetical protein
MTQPTCPRCQRAISLNDTIAFDGNHICHVDCRRPRDLTHEERALLFKYCFGHAVAECSTCAQRFRQQELASDLLGNRTHLCPRCRTDLTENTRAHLYTCAMLPEAVRLRAQEVREAARKLIKESDRVSSLAYVLIAEAEAAIAALRESMRLTA